MLVADGRAGGFGGDHRRTRLRRRRTRRWGRSASPRRRTRACAASAGGHRHQRHVCRQRGVSDRPDRQRWTPPPTVAPTGWRPGRHRLRQRPAAQVVNSLEGAIEIDAALWNLTLNTNGLFFEFYEQDAWIARKQAAWNVGGAEPPRQPSRRELRPSTTPRPPPRAPAAWNALLLPERGLRPMRRMPIRTRPTLPVELPAWRYRREPAAAAGSSNARACS